jgi:paraquat-inducible protein B
MSKPASKTFIGIFVLGAITLLVIAVVVLGSGKFFRKTFKGVCFFEGSVGGLSVGAPVVFNGVRIGQVTAVVLRYDTTDLRTTIPVTIEIDPKQVETVGPRPRGLEKDLKTLIDQGLRSRLELQSIVTGKLQVGLGYHPDKPVRFVGKDLKYPEIPTIPPHEIIKRIEQLPLEEIAKNVATAVEGINRLINSPEIMQTVKSITLAADETRQLVHNVNTKAGPVFSGIEGAIEDTRKLVGDAQKLARNVNDQVQPLSSEAQEALKGAQRLMKDLNEKTTTLASSADDAAKDVQKLVQRVDRQVGPLVPSIQRTLASIEKASDEAGITLRQAQQTLAVLESDVGEDSELIYEIKKAVREVGTAGKAIQSLAKALERQPESLLFGKKQK